MRYFVLLFLFLTSWAQAQIILDSELSDTNGMAADLRRIEAQIGSLADSIRLGLRPITLQYYSFDSTGQPDTQTLHQGVLVVHESVVKDLQAIFKELRRIKFPIQKIVPVNQYGLSPSLEGWEDRKSMADNNTSGFNYRYITNSRYLSPHGMGIAIDFNPLFNPYESYHHDGKFVEPPAAFYNPARPGSITQEVVNLFDQRGWTWGGRWNNPLDIQHFDKRPGRSRKHYLMKETGLKDYFRYGKDGSMILYGSPLAKEREEAYLSVTKKNRSLFLSYADYVPEVLANLPAESNGVAWLKSKKELDQRMAEAKAQLPAGQGSGPLAGKRINLFAVAVGDSGPQSNLTSFHVKVMELLEEKLEQQGAIVTQHLYHDNSSFDSIQTLAKKDKFYGVAHLNLVIDLGNPDSNSQTIFIPGAWKEAHLQDSLNQIYFFRELLGDDFEQSLAFASVLQQQIQQDLQLSPISRQLPAPNVLEQDCIMTDQEGIYCRQLGPLHAYRGPLAYVTLYGKGTFLEAILQANEEEPNWPAARPIAHTFEQAILKLRD